MPHSKMAEIIREVQDRVMRRLFSHAFVVDAKGSLSIDGVTLSGIDGKRALETFLEDIEETAKENGPAATQDFYWRRHQIPVAYGKNLHISMSLAREYDAMEIAGR